MKLFAHILLHDFGLPEDVVERAMQDVVVYGGSLGTNLLELGLIPEAKLLEALAKRYGTKAFDLRDLKVDQTALETVPLSLIRKHKVLPLRYVGKTLELLMVNPSDRVALAEIGMSAGAIIKPFVVVETRLEEMLEQYAGVKRGWRYRENPLDRVSQKRRTIAPASFAEAKALFNAALHRDDVADTLTAFLQRFFARVVVFVHRRDLLVGWRASMNIELDARTAVSDTPVDQVPSLYLPLNRPSVFRTVVESGSPYIGPLGDLKTHAYFLSVMGGRPPASVFVAPLLVMGRVVNIVYGDAGPGAEVNLQLADVVVALVAAADAYERLIRERLKRAP